MLARAFYEEGSRSPSAPATARASCPGATSSRRCSSTRTRPRREELGRARRRLRLARSRLGTERAGLDRARARRAAERRSAGSASGGAGAQAAGPVRPCRIARAPRPSARQTPPVSAGRLREALAIWREMGSEAARGGGRTRDSRGCPAVSPRRRPPRAPSSGCERLGIRVSPAGPGRTACANVALRGRPRWRSRRSARSMSAARDETVPPSAWRSKKAHVPA